MRYCYIYLLLDALQMKGYVGKTIRLEERVKSHWANRSKGKDTYKKRWLRSLPSPPQVVLLGRYSSEEKGLRKERGWIRDLRLGGIELVNTTEGGDGFTSKSIKDLWETPEHRDRMIKAFLERYAKPGYVSPKLGSKHSEETKLKMSLSHLGKKYRPMSDEGRENISNVHKGIKLSETHKENIGEGVSAAMTEEVREKISKTMRTPKMRAEIIARRYGKTYEEIYGSKKAAEIKHKISASTRGQKLPERTEEHRRNHSKALKLWWENHREVECG